MARGGNRPSSKKIDQDEKKLRGYRLQRRDLLKTTGVGALAAAGLPQVSTAQSNPGEEQWRFQTGDHVHSSPTVVDGTVYVGSVDDNLYAVDAASGNEQWRFQTGSNAGSSPTVANGTVYVGSLDNNLYAVDAASGNEQWRFQTGSNAGSSPTVANGTVYVGSLDNNLYAVDAASGNEQWRFQTGSNAGSSPTVANGTVYVGSLDNNLYAVDAASGNEQWRFQTGSNVESSPTVANGTVYVGSEDTNLYAVDVGIDVSSEGSRVNLGTLGHHHVWANQNHGSAYFEVDVTHDPDVVSVGESGEITLQIKNTGDEEGTQEIEGTLCQDGDCDSNTDNYTLDSGEIYEEAAETREYTEEDIGDWKLEFCSEDECDATEWTVEPAESPPETGVVTGTVLDTNNEELADVLLTFIDAETDEETETTLTNDEGDYYVELPAGITYKVVAKKVGYESALKTVTVEEDSSHTIDFSLLPIGSSEPGVVTGTLTNPDENPLANVDLGFADVETNEYTATATTDTNGEYTVELPANTTYEISATDPDYTGIDAEVTVDSGATHSLPLTAELTSFGARKQTKRNLAMEIDDTTLTLTESDAIDTYLADLTTHVEEEDISQEIAEDAVTRHIWGERLVQEANTGLGPGEYSGLHDYHLRHRTLRSGIEAAIKYIAVTKLLAKKVAVHFTNSDVVITLIDEAGDVVKEAVSRLLDGFFSSAESPDNDNPDPRSMCHSLVEDETDAIVDQFDPDIADHYNQIKDWIDEAIDAAVTPLATVMRTKDETTWFRIQLFNLRQILSTETIAQDGLPGSMGEAQTQFGKTNSTINDRLQLADETMNTVESTLFENDPGVIDSLVALGTDRDLDAIVDLLQSLINFGWEIIDMFRELSNAVIGEGAHLSVLSAMTTGTVGVGRGIEITIPDWEENNE